MKFCRNFKFILWVLLSFIVRVFSVNFENFFENFECEDETCYVDGISSSNDLEELYNDLGQHPFKYYLKNDNCQWNGEYYCEKIRDNFETYNEIIFINSTFDKLPSKECLICGEIKSLSLSNVGLTELKRDDLKSFESLEILDLSKNKLESLGSLVFLHLSSLKNLILRKNEIKNIDAVAFDESNQNLRILDLSENKLKEVSENLLIAIGNSDEAQLLLNNNQIQQIIPNSLKKSIVKFNKLHLGNNQLRRFSFNCLSINSLDLSENVLEEFVINNCTVRYLNLNSNKLAYLFAGRLSTLKISNNVGLRNLTLFADDLMTLEMKNLPAKTITYDNIKTARKLIEFDAADTLLGTPKIDTFSEMISLQKLNLSNTGLSHIEYGMFSHQRKMISFDISRNGLQSIDSNKIASMKQLQFFDFSGNNLTELENVGGIKKTFPSLMKVKIDENSWNCSYLANLIKTFGECSIIVLEPTHPVKNLANVIGIACTTTAESEIQSIVSDKSNEVFSNKLNEIIQKINENRAITNNHKFDFDVLKSEIFNIQKEILELKSKIVTLQLETTLNKKRNDSLYLDIVPIRAMMEQLNNFTLEKQKLAYDQLLVKISEVQNQITRINIEQSNFVHKKNLPEMISKSEIPNNQSQNTNKSNSTIEILLTIVITSLILIGAVYAFSKFNKTLKNFINVRNLRARSTNTLNTTVEIPFENENL